MFFRGSRYARVADDRITDAAGRSIRFKRVRFIPETRAEQGHRVSQGERLDHVAQRYFRDPERFWRICDANCALRPDDLMKPFGRILKIPASED